MKFNKIDTVVRVTVVLEEPVLLEGRQIRMGSTDVTERYLVDTAIINTVTTDEGGPFMDVTLIGYKAGKRGKARDNGRPVRIGRVGDLITAPDGTVTYDTSKYDEIVAAALLAASEPLEVTTAPNDEVLVEA